MALILAGIIGLLLQLYYKTGPWTIPLGFMGMVAGFFYSTEPIRWVKRGIGEIIIGFSYGWLPIAVSFYLQTAHLAPLVHLMSLPIALSVFNVILINEFPDYPADLMEGKKTLTVRFGKKSASYIYAAACLGGVVLYPLSLLAGAFPLQHSPLLARNSTVHHGHRRHAQAAICRPCCPGEDVRHHHCHQLALCRYLYARYLDLGHLI